MSGLGGRRRSRGRSDLPMNAEINVTSLVDVAFTLLVIFIITAPMIQGGVEVSVPKADVRALTAEEHPFFITVTREGRIYIEETETTVEEFERSFPRLAGAGTMERVYIRGDSLSAWGPVLKVISTVARAGIDFSVVGEPYGGG